MSEKITLFDRFGGTRKMADDLGEAPSTVQSWKAAERIPAHKQPGVLAKAHELGLPVTAEDIVFPMGRPDELQPSGPPMADKVEPVRPASDSGPEVADSPFSVAEGAMAVSLPTCSTTTGPVPSPAGNPTSFPSSEPKAA